MTGKAYAFVEGIGPDADTGSTADPNNQGQLAAFNTPAEVTAEIAAAIAAFAATLMRSVIFFHGSFAASAAATVLRNYTFATTSLAAPQAVLPLSSAMHIVELTAVNTSAINLATPIVFTVLDNGVATAATVSIPAGSAAVATFVGSVTIPAGHTCTLQAANTNGGALSPTFSAVITCSPIP